MVLTKEDHQYLKDLDRRLWTTADALRSNLDAAVYKHVVLGLIFLKYVSDAFAERRQEVERDLRDPQHDYYLGDDEAAIVKELEERSLYTERNVFWVPARARWEFLRAMAKVAPGTQITLPDGTTEKFKGLDVLLDKAMQAIEDDNPKLKNVLTKDFARLQLDPDKLGRLLDLIAGVGFTGHTRLRAKDLLGHVYEYFLGEFASAEGKKGGQYYTPQAIVTLMVELLEPFKGRIYDPACGSGGFFVQSERFIESHADQRHIDPESARRQIAVYGQESNPTTWRLAQMNLVIRGIEADIKLGDTLLADAHPDLKADYVLANPPFNLKDWGGERIRDDRRWLYAAPPAANANFAWVQHMLYHLAPTGQMGLLLSNGSMSSNASGEGDIRREIILDDKVDCMVALPGQLFTNTQIPACIWLLTHSKKARDGRRKRTGETLFIDARQVGYLKDRVLRDFTADDIRLLADTYHRWQRGDNYADVPGFCKSVTKEEIVAHDYVLTPGRYVGAEEKEQTGDGFEVVMPRLVAQLREQFAESARLQEAIEKNLAGLGYGE